MAGVYDDNSRYAESSYHVPPPVPPLAIGSRTAQDTYGRLPAPPHSEQHPEPYSQSQLEGRNQRSQEDYHSHAYHEPGSEQPYYSEYDENPEYYDDYYDDDYEYDDEEYDQNVAPQYQQTWPGHTDSTPQFAHDNYRSHPSIHEPLPEPGYHRDSRDIIEDDLDKMESAIEAAEDLELRQTGVIEWYMCTLIVGHPIVYTIFALIVIASAAIGGTVALWGGADLDFSNFMKADGTASLQWDSFIAAFSERDEGDAVVAQQPEEEKGNRRAQEVVKFWTAHIIFAYEDKSGNDILTEDNLVAIHGFEASLAKMPMWSKMCGMAPEKYRVFCKSGVSIINFAFPTRKYDADGIRPLELVFDGKGYDAMAVQVAIEQARKAKVDEVIFPKGFNPDVGDTVSTVRSMFRFKMSVDSIKGKSELKKDWEAFIVDEFFPSLPSGLGGVHVFYTGDGVAEYEIMATLTHDLHYAIGSMCFVLLYMVFHTRSVFLSVWGLVLIFLSIPSAYVIFALVSGSTKLTLASFLTFFLTVGLGADVVFVYTDFWQQSAHLSELEDRVIWTYKHAAKACAATSLTTAASFFANLESVLRPLREFGVFMGLCVAMAYILITILFPALCVVDLRWCGCFRSENTPGLTPEDDDSIPVICSICRGPGKVARFFQDYWAWKVGRWRRSLIFIFSAMSITALVFSILNAGVSKGTPEVFPDDHNQARGVRVMASFFPIDEIYPANSQPAQDSGKICQEWESELPGEPSCLLYWCEMYYYVQDPYYYYDEDKAKETKETKEKNAKVCDCYRHESGTCEYETIPGNQQARKVWSTLRIAGAPTSSELPLNKIQEYLTQGEHPIGGVTVGQVKELHPLFMQDWETGTSSVAPYIEVGPTYLPLLRTSRSSSHCNWFDTCYCGANRCEMQGWRSTGQLNVNAQSRRLELKIPWGGAIQENVTLEERSLSASKFHVPSNLRSDVNVMFGIYATGHRPMLGEYEGALWGYSGGFEPEQPWAQRAMWKLCKKVADNLRVTQRRCWIMNFQQWLRAQENVRFPIPTKLFNEKLIEYASVELVQENLAKDFMWFENGKLKGTYFSFQIDVSKNCDPQYGAEMRANWDKYISEFNAESSRFARGAWHTSLLWVRVEAELEILSSTMATLTVSVSLAFVGMLLFTKDVILALYVVFSTVGVISCLAFFIVIIMGWSFGPIEVIALIVFVGYAVTYSLHIAHKYGDASFIATEHEDDELDDQKDDQNDAGQQDTGSGDPQQGTLVLFDKKASAGSSGSTGSRRKSKIGDDVQAPHIDLHEKRNSGQELDPSDFFGGTTGEERFERTRFALQRMGGAALGSATTTLGTAFFLLFCTLQIFKKLGSVIFAVTFLAITFALTPLPAALIHAGPLEPGLGPIIRRLKRVRDWYRAWWVRRKLKKHRRHHHSRSIGTDPKTPESKKHGELLGNPFHNTATKVDQASSPTAAHEVKDSGLKDSNKGQNVSSNPFLKPLQSPKLSVDTGDTDCPPASSTRTGSTDYPGSSSTQRTGMVSRPGTEKSFSTWGSPSEVDPSHKGHRGQDVPQRVPADDERARQATELLDRIRDNQKPAVSSAPLEVDPIPTPAPASDAAIHAGRQVIAFDGDQQGRCLEGCGVQLQSNLQNWSDRTYEMIHSSDLRFLFPDAPQTSSGSQSGGTGPVASSNGSRGPSAPRGGNRGRAPSAGNREGASRNHHQHRESPRSEKKRKDQKAADSKSPKNAFRDNV